MGFKTEIGWTTPGEDGQKRHVMAHRRGDVWNFFERPRRKGGDVQWEPLEEPPLSDWLELLDAMQRRAARDLVPERAIDDLKKQIRERFPEHAF